ncbi:RNA polymerase sigma factor [Spirosoma panaciterrae]|uniref:RNA polymerase sigma factor n=1 Tax=Spirosoma panaciterrae TaxID=496058 RepID=UPI00037AA906|nr:sigma-70 family RNA polymerase sigma factor [Spirosoma panaciterrae]
MARLALVPTDEVLLAQLWLRFKAGDGQAFNQLIQKRYRVLFTYATRFTQDRELIKDCLQELFLELWYRRTNLVDTSYVTIYLIKALRNNLFRLLKKETGREMLLDDWEATGAFLTDGRTHENDLIIDEFCSEKEVRLRQLIDQLPARQQEVIFLKFYKGLSNETIAQMMDVERQTVANFLYRALGTMKSTLRTQAFA